MKYLIILFLTTNLYAAEYIYEEKTGENTEQVIVIIEKLKDGFIVNNKSESYNSTYWLDREYNLESYETLLADGNFIEFYKKIDKIFDGNNNPIHQFDPTEDLWIEDTTNMKSFIISDLETIFFFVIGPNYKKDGSYKEGDYAHMALKAKKVKREVLEINGVQIETVKIMMTTKSAIMSLFWKAYYWYRVSDGIIVYYEDTKGPGAPRTYGTLIDER